MCYILSKKIIKGNFKHIIIGGVALEKHPTLMFNTLLA
jgi:hypothetical protein